ncbi:MAG: NADH-quinone oxidoreductase subunit N [Pseudomonadota bacterium]
MSGAGLQVVMPEIVLALFAVGSLLFAALTSQDERAPTIAWGLSGLFVALAIWIGMGTDGTVTAFGGMVVVDSFARFAKVVILLSAAAVLLVSEGYFQQRGTLRFEYPALVAFAVLGMLVMVSAGDLMLLFLGLEVQALALYVIVALRPGDAKPTQAVLNYVMLGALASAFVIYGASLIYGYAGTTRFAGIYVATDDDVSLGLLFGLVFLLAGLMAKLAAAPFHMWMVDLFETAPLPVTAWLAIVTKVAAVFLLARLLHDAFGGLAGIWQNVLALFAAASMVIGAFGMVGQQDFKRLMAYGGIVHLGFGLMGLAAGTGLGAQAILIYMTIYTVMTVGAFAFILSVQRDSRSATDINALQIYVQRQPLRAAAMMVLVLALAGVPPTAGFFAKLSVMRAAFDGGLLWLALVGGLAMAVAGFAYLRIVYVIYFGEKPTPLDNRINPVNWALLMGAAAFMLSGGINLFGLEQLALGAAVSLVIEVQFAPPLP